MNRTSVEITETSLWLLFIGRRLLFQWIYSLWLTVTWRPFGSWVSQIFTVVRLTSRSRVHRRFFTNISPFSLPWCRPATHMTQLPFVYSHSLCGMWWVRLRLDNFHWHILSSTSPFPSTEFHRYMRQAMQVVYRRCYRWLLRNTFCGKMLDIYVKF